MSTVNGVGGSKPPVSAGASAGGAPLSSEGDATAVLPASSMEISEAGSDVMALLYALTASERDADARGRKQSTERKSVERKDAFDQQREQIRRAKEAKDDGGWLSSVAEVLGSAADAVVGGSPLEDIAHELSEATGCKVFDLAYDFIRPDALLHAALLVTSAATGAKGIQQVGDAKPWEAPKGTSTSLQGEGTSLKTRSQAVADATNTPQVMDGYAATRDCVAGAMLTVATCGTGTLAVVAVASSAALMAEEKADLLGRAGVSAKEKMWLRLGAQAALIVVGASASATSAAKVSAERAKSAALVVNGATQAARGGVRVGQAAYEKASDDHMAEASRFEGLQKHVDRDEQRIIDGLREVSKSYQRTLETIAGTMNERDETRLLIARHLA